MRPVLGNRRLGESWRGMLTDRQLRQLIDLQAARDACRLRLGDLAVAEGYLSEGELTAALSPARLGRQLSTAS